MSYKAALFDMDGTLIDSMWVWWKTPAYVLSKYGIEAPDYTHTLFRDHGYSGSAKILIQDFKIDMTVEEMMKEMAGTVYPDYENRVELKPHAAEYLKSLKDRGITMCIVTANARDLAEITMKRFGLLDYFEGILTTKDKGIPKSEPDLFLEAAELCGVKPEECVVFEDALYSARTAPKIGMGLVAVEDHSSEEDKKELIAISDRFICDYDELKEKDIF